MGRKPKNIEEPIDDAPKKRGRKPKASCRKSTLQHFFQDDDNSYILHLPIGEDDDAKQDTESCMSSCRLTEESIKSTSLDSIRVDRNIKCKNCLKNIRKMNDYKQRVEELEEKLRNLESQKIKVAEYDVNLEHGAHKPKKKKDTLCWWCSHPFTNQPFYIPTKMVGDKYQVYGYFCSVNCAFAYSSEKNDYKVWERNSMIIKLCKTILNLDNPYITAAQQKYKLKEFGGDLSIEEYRKGFIMISKRYNDLIYDET
jgi:hypothetical protein